MPNLTPRTEMCISTASPARIEAALRAVLGLHRSLPNSTSAMYPKPQCRECGDNHPCPSVEAACAALEGR
jgi:hypothetical protein